MFLSITNQFMLFLDHYLAMLKKSHNKPKLVVIPLRRSNKAVINYNFNLDNIGKLGVVLSMT